MFDARSQYNNAAFSSLQLAYDCKGQLLQLDGRIWRDQHSNNNNPLVVSQRQTLISQIADCINLAIENGVNALKISISEKSSLTTMMDDNLLSSIADFIDGIYRNDDIKEAIKNRSRYSLAKSELDRLSSPFSGYNTLFLNGVNKLNRALNY